MASIATHLAGMAFVGCFRNELLFIALLVAVDALRPVFHVLLGSIISPVAVHLRLLVAIHAGNALLVMGVRAAPVLACVFRVNPSAVAEGAGLALVPADEFVALDQPDADAGDRRSLDVAVAA